MPKNIEIVPGAREAVPGNIPFILFDNGTNNFKLEVKPASPSGTMIEFQSSLRLSNQGIIVFGDLDIQSRLNRW